jgi:hypothetical protein
MTILAPNLSITLNQRRWACVLDPSLILSPYGVLLVQSLGEVLELWIARELWHILDNPSFYLTQPEWVMPQTELGLSPELQTVAQQKRLQVLKRWELLRVQTPPGALNLFWIGDRSADSFLPNGTEPQFIQSWEILARSLDRRLQEQSTSGNMMASAFRDTAALAAVLGSAFILTYQPLGESGKVNTPPEICQVLEQWGIPCRQIDSLDAIAVMERENLLPLMISTGFSKFLWAGLHLIVLHLFVPSAFTTGCKTQRSWVPPSWDDEEIPEACLLDCWEGAKGFWYRL